ncbi:DNA sulfur modification protein DndB [Paenibacillus sp. y28]|uniref:DNA sulfur modification protein DndB n=1 Tax=Paenibacillus sp. y28 TaxID=3129110 RepID=UPI00301A918C
MNTRKSGLRLSMAIHPFCEQFGMATLSLRVQDLLNYTAIDPMVQRKLSSSQRRKISKYLQERELDHVFFGPVTLSLREAELLDRQSDGELYLQHGAKLSILDGQHRILALGYVNEQLQKEVKRLEKKIASIKIKLREAPQDAEMIEELEQTEGMLSELESRRLELLDTELAAQVYIGLGEEEERQLFGDINSKVQLVSKELGHSFDSTDVLNVVIQQAAENNMLLKAAGVETRNNLTSFNKNFTCYSWLYSTATMLFSGKMQPSYELARKIRADMTTYIEVMHQFFHAILPIMPEQPGLAQFTSSSRVMQESLALFAHDFAFAGGSYNPNWTDCMKVLDGFDWSHGNTELIERFGTLQNGKLNLIHEKSLRKHGKLVQFFHELGGDRPESIASPA